MILKLKNIFQIPIVKYITILASGTLLAQVISLLASPIITRIFSPDIFGYFGIFMSIVSIVSSFSTLTFSQAIVIPKQDIIFRYLVLISYISVLIVSILSLIILYFFNDFIAVKLNALAIKDYFILIPLFILIGSFIQIYEQVLIREKKFKTISKITVNSVIIMNGLQIIIGFLKPTILVFILTTFISKLYNVFAMYRVSKVNIYSFSLLKIKYTVCKYKGFPYF